jgi:hypothetical protein
VEVSSFLTGERRVAGMDELDDERGEPRIEFTDEEWAFLRYVRFGELPPRVRPDEMVEAQETEPGGGFEDTSGEAWRRLRSGGA